MVLVVSGHSLNGVAGNPSGAPPRPHPGVVMPEKGSSLSSNSVTIRRAEGFFVDREEGNLSDFTRLGSDGVWESPASVTGDEYMLPSFEL